MPMPEIILRRREIMRDHFDFLRYESKGMHACEGLVLVDLQRWERRRTEHFGALGESAQHRVPPHPVYRLTPEG